MNNQIGFDEVASKNGRGGSWTPENLNEHPDMWIKEAFVFHQDFAHRWIEFIRVSSPRSLPTMPKINFGYNASYKYGGFADIDAKGNAHIGINIGSVLLIYDLFNHIFRSPDIFPFIGNSSVEIEPDTPYAGISANEMYPAAKSLYEENAYKTPIDEIRQRAAIGLARNAVNVLVAHELAHHRYGHLQYLGSKGLPFSLLFQGEGSTESSDITRPCLEGSADSWAISQTLFLFFQTSDLKQVNLEELEFFILSIYSVFRISEFNSIPSGLYQKNHPAPILRFWWSLLVVQEQFNKVHGQHVDINCPKYLLNAENVISKITKSQSKIELFHRVIGKEGKEALARFSEAFSEMQPDLAKFVHATDYDFEKYINL